MARKKKAATRPAIERVPNVVNVRAALADLAKYRAELIDADKMVATIRENAGKHLPPELMEDIKKKYTDAAFRALHESAQNLAPMLRLAIRALAESCNYRMLADVAESLIKTGIFKSEDDADSNPDSDSDSDSTDSDSDDEDSDSDNN